MGLRPFVCAPPALFFTSRRDWHQRGELQPLNSGPKYSDLQLSVRESGFHDQLSEVTKKRLPFGVGSGELSGSRWWQLGAAVRCFGGEAAIFCSRAAEACGATV